MGDDLDELEFTLPTGELDEGKLSEFYDLAPELPEHLVRAILDKMSEAVEEWQGIPIPLGNLNLRLHERHPLARVVMRHELGRDGQPMQIICGGPRIEGDEEEHVVNHWYSAKLNVDVYVYRSFPSKTSFAVKIPRSPDGSMDRLKLWVNTIGASDGWDLDAEYRAREKLRGMLTERQWRHYDLTGSFIESSPRSRLTYVFRRLRPTIALTPRWPWYRTRLNEDAVGMKCLAVLCLHSIGYYDESWGGCLVPTDDVISHLLFMRADEAGFWKAANQHEAWRPEAGL